MQRYVIHFHYVMIIIIAASTFPFLIFFYFYFYVCKLSDSQVTVATQTGHDCADFLFNPDKMTTDRHCYECKVRYRDPKPQDLVMYLHAWKYQVSQINGRRFYH